MFALIVDPPKLLGDEVADRGNHVSGACSVIATVMVVLGAAILTIAVPRLYPGSEASEEVAS